MSEKIVKVYSTPTCPYCKTVKSFLDTNNVTYQDLDVSADKAARDEMIEKSGQMVVPQIYIDGEIVVGFDQAALKEKLELK